MDGFDIPEPKKIAPVLTSEQRQAMAPIDLLVQYVMPKLLDKVNHLEWAVKADLFAVKKDMGKMREYADNLNRSESNNTVLVNDRIAGMDKRLAEVERGLASIADVNTRMLKIVHDGGQEEQKPKRKKKISGKTEAELDSEPKPAPVKVDISEPVAMSAIAQYDAAADNWVPKIIDGVEITAGVVNDVMDGGSSYPVNVMAFIYDLSEDERKVLCAQFPDEITEEVL